MIYTSVHPFVMCDDDDGADVRSIRMCALTILSIRNNDPFTQNALERHAT